MGCPTAAFEHKAWIAAMKAEEPFAVKQATVKHGNGGVSTLFSCERQEYKSRAHD